MGRATKIIREAMEERRPYADYEDSGFYLHNARDNKLVSGPNTEEEAHRQKAEKPTHQRDNFHVLYRDTEGGWNRPQRTYPFAVYDDDPPRVKPHF